MKSQPIGPAENILASDHNTRRDDARGAGSLLAHQALGTLALGTNASNNQVVPIVINGTTITVTFVSSIGSTPNNVLIGASAAASAQNLVNFLRRPDLTSSTQVAASGANQALLQYVGWAYPGSTTNIVPFSLNKNVNGLTGLLTSFNITGITVTAGTWTANTMALYVEEGTYYIGNTQVKFTGGLSPTVTAPSSHPRIDVLTIDTSGTLAWTTGSENVSPTVPSYPAGKYPICELYNVVSETALYDNENQQGSQGYIQADVRPITNLLYINSAGQIAANIVLMDPGSAAEGDIFYANATPSTARLPAGTSGFFLKTLGAGANPAWAAVNPILNSQVADATVGGLNSEVTLYTYTMPGNTMGANGRINVRIYFSDLNQASGTLTLKIYIGVTAIISFTPTQGLNNDGGVLDCDIINNGTGTQIAFATLYTGDNGAVSTTNMWQYNTGTAAIDTTSSAVVKCTMQSSTSSNTPKAKAFAVTLG